MKTRIDDDLSEEILALVALIPRGKVATYGQLARLSGREKSARLVGRVLSRAAWYGDYPCHRVVDHSGRLASGWPQQRQLLLAEGLPFRDERHVRLKEALWDGEECEKSEESD